MIDNDFFGRLVIQEDFFGRFVCASMCALDLYFLQHLVYHDVTFMSLVFFLAAELLFNSSTLVIKSLDCGGKYRADILIFSFSHSGLLNFVLNSIISLSFLSKLTEAIAYLKSV